MSSESIYGDDWKVLTASEYCVNVADGTHDSPKKTEMGKLLVTSKNVVGGSLDLSKSYFISESDFHEINKRSKVDENDVLLSMIGTVGEPCLIIEKPDFAIKNVGLLKNDDPIKARWLYFYLSSPYGQSLIKERTRGSTQQYIPLGEIRNLPIHFPSNFEKMKSIVDQLSTLQDKIHLNQQTNETLEAMAKAIFKSWFVDFDPVRAKIAAKKAGRDPEKAAMAAIAGISLEQDWDEIETALQHKLNRMNSDQANQLRHTASLFPDELVESELGEVPKGWEISEIGKEVTSVGGTTPRTKNPEYWEGGKIAWTTPKDLSNVNSKILLETDRRITGEGLNQISSGLLPVDTVLMSSRAPVGYLALSKIPVAINQGYIAMICDKVLNPEYVLHWIESNMDMIKQHAGGSTFSEISKRNFRPLPVLVPDEVILEAYSEKGKSLYNLITANLEEIKSLEKVRDTLLPKLISGEVEV